VKLCWVDIIPAPTLKLGEDVVFIQHQISQLQGSFACAGVLERQTEGRLSFHRLTLIDCRDEIVLQFTSSKTWLRNPPHCELQHVNCNCCVIIT
jgi:hypothetical protein